jgi:UDP-N-acetylglucosamine--N-acetylmuramyl-(pentapeptide) pyrophosphoryl-undecaprenol N-acetylglucosamine transferase
MVGGQRPATVLHEQNAVLGRANRLLSRGADALALAIAQTQRVPEGAQQVVVGNPVRPAVAALAGQGFLQPQGSVRLLVLGGSLGARIFSDIVPAAIADLPAPLRQRLSVVQQCRTEDLPRVRAAYEALHVPAELSPFFGDVAGLYSTAHLVIARAGASTVAELACAGRASLLVPLPGAIDDHQSANARALADAGAARVVRQQDFTPTGLAAALTELLEAPDALARAAAAAAALAAPQAAATLADLVLSRAAARGFQE